MVEHPAVNRVVVGSSPTRGAIFCLMEIKISGLNLVVPLEMGPFLFFDAQILCDLRASVVKIPTLMLQESFESAKLYIRSDYPKVN